MDGPEGDGDYEGADHSGQQTTVASIDFQVDTEWTRTNRQDVRLGAINNALKCYR